MNILVSVANVTEDLLKRLTLLHVGIEVSYFSYPWNLDKANLATEIANHQAMLQDFPLEKSLHGAFYDLNPIARDNKLVEVCDYRIQQSLEIAAKLGTKKVVFHTNFIPSTKTDYLSFWIEKQVLFWQKYLSFIEREGITILLENTREENAHHILPIVKTLQNPFVKICYDTGHSHCFTTSKEKPATWVANYQEELSYIHLHSNHGETDEHIAFTEGTVDFTDFWENLALFPQFPDIVIEVKTKKAFEKSLKALRERFI